MHEDGAGGDVVAGIRSYDGSDMMFVASILCLRDLVEM